jgi:hypothetical protein
MDCPNCEATGSLQRVISFNLRKPSTDSKSPVEHRLKKHFDEAKEELAAQKKESRKDYTK